MTSSGFLAGTMQLVHRLMQGRLTYHLSGSVDSPPNTHTLLHLRLVTLVRHTLAVSTLNPWVHLATAGRRGLIAVASATERVALLALTRTGGGGGGGGCNPGWALQPIAEGRLGVDDVIADVALSGAAVWSTGLGGGCRADLSPRSQPQADRSCPRART